MNRSVSLSIKSPLTTTDDVYRATLVVLKGVVTGDVSTNGDVILDTLMKGQPKVTAKILSSRKIDKMLSDKTIKCLSATVIESAKYTLQTLQTSLGIYTITDIAGMIVSFQKGPVLGLVGRINDKYFVVDVERKVIVELEPIVGFVKYIRTHHNAALKGVFTFDILLPNKEVYTEVSEELASQKTTGKRKSPPTTKTSATTRRQKRIQTRAKRKKVDDELAESPRLGVSDELTESLELGEDVELSGISDKKLNDDNNNNNNNNEEEKDEARAEPMKKKGKAAKKTAAPDLFDILSGDVEITTMKKTRSATKKKGAKKTAGKK